MRRRGFSLIEMLIVLAVLGVASSVVVPNLWSSFEKASERTALYDYADSILTLRRELYEQRRGISLDAGQLVLNPAPPGFPGTPVGWQVQRQSELAFLPNGVCSGGELIMESPTQRVWRLRFAPLDAQPSVELL